VRFTSYHGDFSVQALLGARSSHWTRRSRDESTSSSGRKRGKAERVGRDARHARADVRRLDELESTSPHSTRTGVAPPHQNVGRGAAIIREGEVENAAETAWRTASARIDHLQRLERIANIRNVPPRPQPITVINGGSPATKK